jgi:hypothetical protein
MSAGEKMDPARAWMHVDEMLDDEEIARIEGLTEAELDEELRQRGIDPDRVPSAEELLARAEERAAERRVVPLRRPTRRRRVARAAGWLALAAVVALVLGLAAARRTEIAAWWHGDPEIGPDNDDTAPPEQRAMWLRRDAEWECVNERWSACEAKLDEARGLDPAGDTAPAVQALRKQLSDALGPPAPAPNPAPTTTPTTPDRKNEDRPPVPRRQHPPGPHAPIK